MHIRYIFGWLPSKSSKKQQELSLFTFKVTKQKTEFKSKNKKSLLKFKQQWYQATAGAL